MSHSLKLTDEMQEAYGYLYPKWQQLPDSIRPDEQALKQIITDYSVESRIVKDALNSNIVREKPAARFSTKQAPYKMAELKDKSINVAFSNAITRLEMLGLDPIEDLKEFGFNRNSVRNATYLAERLFTRLPLLSDCFHSAFVDSELYPTYTYRILCVAEHLSSNIGINGQTSCWRGYDLDGLLRSLLKELPQGYASTDILLGPIKDLLSLTAKGTLLHFLSKAILNQLKLKPLLLSEKAVRKLMESMVDAAEALFRENYLLVPYPRNKTLDLLYSRKTLQNNVIVHPPSLCSEEELSIHKELEQAIWTKSLKVYLNGQLLFKEGTGECAIKLPTLDGVKRAIVREELCLANSYDLLVLQLAAIESGIRLVRKAPLSNIPQEYLLTCRRVFDASWIDSKIAKKLKRLLTGHYSFMGEEDVKGAQRRYYAH